MVVEAMQPVSLAVAPPAARRGRILATLLFTDLVDATTRTVQLGDRAWARLLEQHHAAVRRRLAEHGGRELDSAGDGFFAAFATPGHAIECAHAIRADLAGLGLRVRAGIHAGECELVDGKLAGIAVHVGARIAADADAGEILVSTTVRELVAGSGHRFADRGTRATKGLPEPYRVFALAPPLALVPAAQPWPSHATTAEIGAGPLTIRPLRSGDTTTIQSIFDGLGERSRRLRFGGAKTMLLPHELEQFALVDEGRQVLVAYLDGAPVGVARLVRDDAGSDDAEIAGAVVDSLQGSGIGTALIERLAADALTGGLVRLRAAIDPANRVPLALMRRVATSVESRRVSGELHVVAFLGSENPSRAVHAPTGVSRYSASRASPPRTVSVHSQSCCQPSRS